MRRLTAYVLAPVLAATIAASAEAWQTFHAKYLSVDEATYQARTKAVAK